MQGGATSLRRPRELRPAHGSPPSALASLHLSLHRTPRDDVRPMRYAPRAGSLQPCVALHRGAKAKALQHVRRIRGAHRPAILTALATAARR